MTTKLPEPYTNGTVWNGYEYRSFPLYTASQLAAARREALEEAARVCERLKTEHVEATSFDPCGIECEFVTAWTDAAEAIRALAGKEGER